MNRLLKKIGIHFLSLADRRPGGQASLCWAVFVTTLVAAVHSAMTDHLQTIAAAFASAVLSQQHRPLRLRWRPQESRFAHWLLVQRVELPELVEVTSFDEAGLADTSRGAGGHGSSGGHASL